MWATAQSSSSAATAVATVKPRSQHPVVHVARVSRAPARRAANHDRPPPVARVHPGRRASKSPATGSRKFASRGAGRTGRIRQPGDETDRKPVDKPLGGEQVEGRQAVRELLIAGKRRVREVWISAEPDATEVVSDIVEIARTMRVTVTQVARKRLDQQARSEASARRHRFRRTAARGRTRDALASHAEGHALPGCGGWGHRSGQSRCACCAAAMALVCRVSCCRVTVQCT